MSLAQVREFLDFFKRSCWSMGRCWTSMRSSNSSNPMMPLRKMCTRHRSHILSHFKNSIYVPLECKPSVKITSSLVIVRSSPGVAVLPLMALTPISTARPTVPLVEYQYRISSGMTWIIETRGSLASPL